MLGTLSRSLELQVPAPSRPSIEGLTDFVRLSLATYERNMAAVLRTFDPGPRDAEVPPADTRMEPVQQRSAA